MGELSDAAAAPAPPSEERLVAYRLAAKRAIEASLELADELGAA